MLLLIWMQYINTTTEAMQYSRIFIIDNENDHIIKKKTATINLKFVQNISYKH